MRFFSLRIFFSICFFLALFLFAKNSFAEKISFSAQNMSGRAGSKEDTTTLSGNANVTTETIEVKADSIELSGNDFRYVSAEGNISGKHKESNLEFWADTLEYDRETKIVTLSGNVKLIDIENEVTALAQIIEYNTNTEIAILQIEVNLKQKKNVCTAVYAIYRKKEQMLELNGAAKVVQEDDTFSAQTITFNMDTEEIVMEGNVRGSVTDDGSHDGEKTENEEGEQATLDASDESDEISKDKKNDDQNENDAKPLEENSENLQDKKNSRRKKK